MNEIIDVALVAAKLATIKDEKAKMVVDSVSLAYNATQIFRFRSMIAELSELCSCIAYQSRLRGGCTQEEYSLATQCQQQIEDCNKQIAKYGVMSVIDLASLLVADLKQR